MNKTNYQALTDMEIKRLNGRKASLLLHACCAPCSSASLEYLVKYFDITLFFYNPNISSAEEFNKRLSELERFTKECPFANGIRVISPEYNHREFLDAAAGLENAKEGGKRCEQCFRLRLNKTAEQAEKSGYEYFATTLTISPLKNAEKINSCGEAAVIGNVIYLPTDLKKRERYKRSIELSKQYGLYRQSFCGCEFSKVKTDN
ncbi:MAG: epoxyqueuosine reductase QueH [Acutalibacteraceae bacterium]|nr:epoxyqueuosine reductase QueH [Acutalibacteraceae bacterium]